MRLAPIAIAILLSGCHLALPAAGGAISTWLTVIETAEKDAELAIHLSEESGCIISARDLAQHEQVSAIANALCAQLIIEKSGGVL